MSNATRMNDALQPTGHPHPLLADSQPREHTAPTVDQLADALPSAVDAALRRACPDQYTPEKAARIAATVVADLTAQPAGPCPVYRDCVDADPGHYDHYNHGIRVTADDDGATILDAGMAAFSGDSEDERRPVVYLRNTDYHDAASVHATTAKLRALLDQVDAMADRVFADHGARGAVPAGGAA
ncbi:hypothetical protein ACIQSP_19970 [Streptomyces nigra]|uniref:hypothetical protein n=1 Tax=Streptomyces nigra TaxID=1827580 RepID=UPI00381DA822